MMWPFNYEYYKCWMQRMLNQGPFDARGSGRDWSWTSEEKMNKIWEAHARFVTLLADMSRAVVDNMVELAQKQAEIVRRNAESCADLCKKNSQSMPTHQEIMETFKDGAERNMQDAKELADICARGNSRLFDACRSRCSCGCTNCSCGAKDAQTVNSNSTKKSSKQ